MASSLDFNGGNYPIESRAGEIARLRIQGEAMAPETLAMLRLIGVQEGSSCLDVGCGPGGITGLLSELVGVDGRVVGLDMNAGFLDVARVGAPGNVEFRLGDAYQTGMAADQFDLVHMRFVASTAGGPERLIEEALRVARAGGTIGLQEPDGSSLNCFPPDADWDRLKAALLGAFAGVGADLQLARRLYSVALEAGLEDVQYRTFVLGVRSMDAMVDYLPSTVESLRETVVRLGLISADDLPGVLDRCRAHLAKPGTAFTMYTVAQVWGKKASG